MTAVPDAIRPRFEVRPYRQDDQAFVYSSFLKSFRASPLVEGIPNVGYYEIFQAEWARVLGAFDVLVAHPPGEPDEIAGWIAHRGDIVAWVYVKKDPWRGLGVARLLWTAAGLGKSVRALFAAPWALDLAQAKGICARLATHVEAAVALAGVR